MGKILISWDYGRHLLDDDFLVSEVKRLREELANFNWDYMMVPDSSGDFYKVTDPDRIDRRYDHLAKLVPELEKMCKERGLDLSKIEAQEKSLSERLNDFYKDFDFYDYMDSVGNFENHDEVIAELEAQLKDAEAVNGILDALVDIEENGNLSDAQRLVLGELMLDVSELLVELSGKELDSVLSAATERAAQQSCAGARDKGLENRSILD